MRFHTASAKTGRRTLRSISRWPALARQTTVRRNGLRAGGNGSIFCLSFVDKLIQWSTGAHLLARSKAPWSSLRQAPWPSRWA